VTEPSSHAADLERASEDIIAFAESCSPEEWVTVVPGDNWPVCVVVHHVAEGYDLVSGWIDCALTGRPVEHTASGIDAANSRHADDFAGVGVQEAVDLLRVKGSAAVAKIRGLNVSDLALAAPFGPAGGQPFSVEQFCVAAAGHVRSHLGRAATALGRDAPP
jgi:hypothetical protein